MKIFDCPCKYRFIVGRKLVYGPIYAYDLPGHFEGDSGCHRRGRLMSREQFEDDYADCAHRLEREHTERHAPVHCQRPNCTDARHPECKIACDGRP